MSFSIIARDKKQEKEIPQTLERLLELLKDLPAEVERQYEVDIVDYATKCSDEVLQAAEKEFWEQYQTAVQNAGKPEDQQAALDEKVYFALYAMMVNYTRRMKADSVQKELLDLYISCNFKEPHVFYTHLRLLRMLGQVYNQSPSERMEMLKLAEVNKKDLYKNEGAAHAFAEAVALVYELDDVADTPRFADQRSEWLENAMSAADKVVNEKPDYAKYYCTRARIESLLGKYADALKDIDKAIDKEDISRKDYAIRIGSYESRGQQIRGKMEQTGVRKNFEDHMAAETQRYQDELVAREKETATKNMEFLGLFSGIVSFTIGSLTISGAIAEQSIAAAAGLIVVLMGALIAAFAGFGIILHGACPEIKNPADFRKQEKSAVEEETQKSPQEKTKKEIKAEEKAKKKANKVKRDWRNVVVLILGLLIVLGGLLLCMCIPNPSATPEETTALTRTVLELV